MSKLTKNQKLANEKIEAGKSYTLEEAAALLKEITFTKFDASTDIDVRLGVDPRKADQNVRGTVSLPHGTGKTVRVLVLIAPGEQADACKAAGADYVGLDEYIEKIKGGWTDVDVIITQPQNMGKVGPLGRVLGPRGLMPNPKLGTVTMDLTKAISEIKAGKVEYRTDKAGNVHCPIGKASFDAEKLVANFNALMDTLIRVKPAAAKGQYIRSVTVSATMGPGVPVVHA